MAGLFGPTDLEINAKAKEAKKRRMAEQLRSIGQNLGQGQMVSGRYVSSGPLGALLSAGSGIMADNYEKSADQGLIELQKTLRNKAQTRAQSMIPPNLLNRAEAINASGGNGQKYIEREMATTNEMKNAYASGKETPLKYTQAIEQMKYGNKQNLQDDRQAHELEKQRYSQNHDYGKMGYQAGIKRGEIEFKNDLDNRTTVTDQIFTDPVTGQKISRPVTNQQRISAANGRNMPAQATGQGNIQNAYMPQNVGNDVLASNQAMMNDPNSIIGTVQPNNNVIMGDIQKSESQKFNDKKTTEDKFKAKEQARTFLSQQSQQVQGYQNGLKDMDRALALLNDGINSGAWGGWAQSYDTLAPEFLGGEKQKAANTQEYEALLSSQVLENMAKLGGSDTEKELEYVKNTSGANPRLLKPALEALILKMKGVMQGRLDEFKAQQKLYNNGLYDQVLVGDYSQNVSSQSDDDIRRQLNARE